MVMDRHDQKRILVTQDKERPEPIGGFYVLEESKNINNTSKLHDPPVVPGPEIQPIAVSRSKSRGAFRLGTKVAGLPVRRTSSFTILISSTNSFIYSFRQSAFFAVLFLASLISGSTASFSPIECSSVKRLLISGFPFLDNMR